MFALIGVLRFCWFYNIWKLEVKWKRILEARHGGVSFTEASIALFVVMPVFLVWSSSSVVQDSEHWPGSRLWLTRGCLCVDIIAYRLVLKESSIHVEKENKICI